MTTQDNQIYQHQTPFQTSLVHQSPATASTNVDNFTQAAHQNTQPAQQFTPQYHQTTPYLAQSPQQAQS